MERVITVKVIPKSSSAGVIGWERDILRVRVSSAPVRGAATREVIALVADYFKLPKRCVKVVSGERSRLKRLLIEE